MAELAIAASIFGAASTIGAGNAAERDADFEARQLKQQANAERATAQREAIEARRQARLKMSRVRAIAGSGASDKTVLDIMDDIQQNGELEALNRLFEGESRGQQSELAARVTRSQGKQAKRSSRIDAASTLISDASSLHSRFG